MVMEALKEKSISVWKSIDLPRRHVQQVRSEREPIVDLDHRVWITVRVLRHDSCDSCFQR